MAPEVMSSWNIIANITLLVYKQCYIRYNEQNRFRKTYPGRVEERLEEKPLNGLIGRKNIDFLRLPLSFKIKLGP